MFVSTRRTFLKAAAAATVAAPTPKLKPRKSPRAAGRRHFTSSPEPAGTSSPHEPRWHCLGPVWSEEYGRPGAAAPPSPTAAKSHALQHTGDPSRPAPTKGSAWLARPLLLRKNTRLWLQQNITWPWNGQKFKKFSKVAQPSKTIDKGLSIGIRYGYISDSARTAISTSTSRRTSSRATPLSRTRAGQWSIGGPGGWVGGVWRTSTHPECGQ